MRLVTADVYRDGGSYGARFSGDDGTIYTLWLQRSAMPDEAGRHHRDLFLYAGEFRPFDCKPIPFHSNEECSIVTAIVGILAASEGKEGHAAEPSPYHIEQLRQMLSYIRIRDPW